MQEVQGQPSHGSSQLSAPQEKDGTEHLQLQVQYMHEKPICMLKSTWCTIRQHSSTVYVGMAVVVCLL